MKDINILELFKIESRRQDELAPGTKVSFFTGREDAAEDSIKKYDRLWYEKNNDGRLTVVFENNDDWKFYYQGTLETDAPGQVAVSMSEHGKVSKINDSVYEHMSDHYRCIIMDYQFNQKELGIQKNINRGREDKEY